MNLIETVEQRLRSIGVRHKLGYVRVWLRGLFSPLPPKGSFPTVSTATEKPDGLLAIGGVLTNETLLEAYGKGIYPMFYKRPVKWWSNDPRMVLFIEKMHIAKRMRRVVRSKCFNVTFDTAFAEVIGHCGNRERTWLTPEMIEAFVSLHESGHAHSVEVWDLEGQLVGGLYGVDLGKVFTTESLFAHANHASKVAFIYLNCHLQQWGYVLNDAQVASEHFRQLGCENISRNQYVQLLSELQPSEKKQGKWTLDERFDVGAWVPSEPGSQWAGTTSTG